MYIMFDRTQHRLVEGHDSQLMWGDDRITVKWHQKYDAFCEVKTVESNCCYMNKEQACKHFREDLGMIPRSSTENIGLKRTALSTNFDPESGLAKVFETAKDTEPILIDALMSGDKKEALKSFKDTSFEAPAVAVFTSGWPKGDKYAEWAEGTKLSTADLKVKLGFSVDKSNKKVIDDLLQEEKEHRAILVNMITALRALELLSKRCKKGDPVKSIALAIARQLLSILKLLLVNWMEAKIELRKRILHDQETEAAKILLKSDVWQPVIFTQEAAIAAKRSKNLGIASLLNLNSDGSLIKGNRKVDTQRGRHQDYNKPFKNNQSNWGRKETYYKRYAKDSFRDFSGGPKGNQQKPSSSQNKANDQGGPRDNSKNGGHSGRGRSRGGRGKK